MKKSIIASVLGIVASVAMVSTSYGQGQVFFQNYSATPSGLVSAPVTYGGLAVGNSFNANLLYSLDGGATYTDMGLAVPFYGNFNGDTANFAGLFADPSGVLTIPGYSSGSIDFIVQAFDGANYASSLIRGQSSVVTLSILATAANSLPPGSLLSDNSAATAPLQAFSVTAVPEPGTLALAGLGGFGMLMAFRRKKA